MLLFKLNSYWKDSVNKICRKCFGDGALFNFKVAEILKSCFWIRYFLLQFFTNSLSDPPGIGICLPVDWIFHFFLYCYFSATYLLFKRLVFFCLPFLIIFSSQMLRQICALSNQFIILKISVPILFFWLIGYVYDNKNNIKTFCELLLSVVL